MALKKNQLFKEVGLKELIDNPTPEIFPPVRFKFKNLILWHLGSSNKNDLIPVNFDENTPELNKAITFGKIGQFIYVSEEGDLYDVCLYQDDKKNIYLYGIRTRRTK